MKSNYCIEIVDTFRITSRFANCLQIVFEANHTNMPDVSFDHHLILATDLPAEHGVQFIKTNLPGLQTLVSKQHHWSVIGFVFLPWLGRPAEAGMLPS